MLPVQNIIENVYLLLNTYHQHWSINTYLKVSVDGPSQIKDNKLTGKE